MLSSIATHEPLPFVPATVTTLYGGARSPSCVEHGDEPVETQIDPLRMHRLEPGEPTIER